MDTILMVQVTAEELSRMIEDAVTRVLAQQKETEQKSELDLYKARIRWSGLFYSHCGIEIKPDLFLHKYILRFVENSCNSQDKAGESEDLSDNTSFLRKDQEF